MDNAPGEQMAQTATKREARKVPAPGTFWTNGKELFYITYSRPEDDVLYIEDCRTYKVIQMRRWDWNRCSMREVKR